MRPWFKYVWYTNMDESIVLHSKPSDIHSYYLCGVLPFNIPYNTMISMFNKPSDDGLYCGMVCGIEFAVCISVPTSIYSKKKANVVDVLKLITQYVVSYLTNTLHSGIKVHLTPYVHQHVVGGILQYITYPFVYNNITYRNIFSFVGAYCEIYVGYIDPSNIIYITGTYSNSEPVKIDAYDIIFRCNTEEDALYVYKYLAKLGFITAFMVLSGTPNKHVVAINDQYGNTLDITWDKIYGVIESIF